MEREFSNQAVRKVRVYCPRGCNQTLTNIHEPWDECAACGQRMTPSAEESYYDGLEQSGQTL